MRNSIIIARLAVRSLIALFIVSVISVGVVYASEDAHEADGHEEHHDEHDTEAVKLSSDVVKELGIEIETAAPGLIQEYIEVPGEIVVNEDTKSHLSARFPGTVKVVHKKLGDSVKKDEVLAIIESNESLTAYELKSPQNGVVIAKHIAPGEFVQEDVAITVANLDDIWVNLSIYQQDLPRVKPGQEVLVSQGHNLPEINGTIRYVSPFVNEETRTAIAQVVLPNEDGIWRPGLFVTGKISISEKNVPLRIRKTALQQVEGKTSVFLETEEGFVPSPVELGLTNGFFAEVHKGMVSGDRYVAANSFALKAELEKEAFGDDHGH